MASPDTGLPRNGAPATAAGKAALREQCRRRLPEGTFEVSATAWAVIGRT